MNSSFFRVNWADLGKALLLVFISIFAAPLLAVVDSGRFPTQEELLAAAVLGVKAAALYLIKNLLTNSEGKFAKKEPAAPAA